MTAIGSQVPPGPGATELAAQSELEAIAQEASSYGALALALARRIDRDLGTDSGFAALVARFGLVMMAARASGVAPAGSHTDEIRRKREERRARGA